VTDPHSSYQASFAAALEAAGLPASYAAEETARRMELLSARLGEFGKRFNLTAITEPGEVLLKHVVDSLMAAPLIDSLAGNGKASLLDIGSGAGFPALPLASVLPRFSVTALDATAKKCRYIDETAREMGLSNVKALNARAEEVPELRGSFDVVTARAVARFRELCELAAPLLKNGGYLVAMKGPSGAEEAEEAKNALKILGLAPVKIISYELPEGAGERTLLVTQKVKPTPTQYPRPWAKIVKNPL